MKNTDYIEREQAITVVKTFYGRSLPVILDALREEHAANVREVVLCKDCYAYRNNKNPAESVYLDPKMYCGLLRCEMSEDSFCSYGKKTEVN